MTLVRISTPASLATPTEVIDTGASGTPLCCSSADTECASSQTPFYPPSLDQIPPSCSPEFPYQELPGNLLKCRLGSRRTGMKPTTCISPNVLMKLRFSHACLNTDYTVYRLDIFLFHWAKPVDSISFLSHQVFHILS